MLPVKVAGWWCCIPLIPALGRKRQADFCEFQDSQDYTETLSEIRVKGVYHHISLVVICVE